MEVESVVVGAITPTSSVVGSVGYLSPDVSLEPLIQLFNSQERQDNGKMVLT